MDQSKQTSQYNHKRFERNYLMLLRALKKGRAYTMYLSIVDGSYTNQELIVDLIELVKAGKAVMVTDCIQNLKFTFKLTPAGEEFLKEFERKVEGEV